MENTVFDRKKTIIYLVFTFAVSWAAMAGVTALYWNGLMLFGQLALMGVMFVPMLGVLVARGGFSKVGWKPRFKRNIKWILLAWFLPSLFTALGAVLFFLIFPWRFDVSGAVMNEIAGMPDALEQMEAQGLSFPLYIVIMLVATLTYAPMINTFPSVGEEVGWRGFLYPQLKARFGKTKGRLLGGVIWGLWHCPLIWTIGYEYGSDYFGFPFLGMLIFCVFTVSLGILLDIVYEKSESIWLPSLAHGAVNAAATLPLILVTSAEDPTRLLGPVPNGLIASLPLIAASILVLWRENKK